MGEVFFEITLVTCLAAVLAIIFRLLKQPAILAYILAGILLGPLGFFDFQGKEFLSSLAEIGITLLLFMLALELRLSGLRSVGRTALTVGLYQMGITLTSAYIIAVLLGFSWVSSLYIAIALTFSSTIIIVKLLADRKDLNSLHGKIMIGLLLLQDFAAIFVLVVLSAFSSDSGGLTPMDILLVLVKGALLIGFTYAATKVAPKIVHPIARSDESLFLFSLAWVFGFAAVVSSPFFGFPIEIGGFAAGIALANSSENFQIAARVRALRDFFITIFFVNLGMHMSFGNVSSLFIQTIILSLFVLVIKPFVVHFIMSDLGYRSRTSFLTGITIGQISEFSLIILFIGSRLHHIPQEIVSLGTLVGITSFTLSSYSIMNSNILFRKVHKFLSVFEKENAYEEAKHGSTKEEIGELQGHIALIGADRMGRSILQALHEEKEKVIVVDFNPDIVKELKDKGALSLFGDISDLDIQERAKLSDAKHVISTVSDREDNLHLIKSLNKTNKKAKIIVVASDKYEAKALYKAGADYVVQPHLIGGRHLARIIKEDKLDSIHKLKEKDMNFVY